ncbi:MAG TPA: GcrA family cell cycle regulator, partial [Pseudorhizobium sp.]|nr:GcrA family cell cycle regulator [Pseudorhizobium sp.]
KDDFHFCGVDAADTSPYCSYHAKLAYQPVAERRRAAARA